MSNDININIIQNPIVFDIGDDAINFNKVDNIITYEIFENPITFELKENPITFEVASNFLLTAETLDQSVSVADVLKLRFPNDSLVNDGGGTVTVSFINGVIYFDTVAEMQATVGSAGNIAYALNYVDQHFKWSVLSSKWIPAF